MADLYSLYDSIDIDGLRSDAENYKSKLEEYNGNLANLSGELNDDIWLADSKSNLISAFDKMNNDIYMNLNKRLTDVVNVTNYIADYRENRNDAYNFKDLINQIESHGNSASALYIELEKYETRMEKDINEINSICGG